MSSYSHDTLDGGLDVVRLQNAVVELAIAPVAGGKIVALLDRRTGRDWLWKNRHIPITCARRGADFGRELDSGGWDEVLFSVKPAVIGLADKPDRSIPDHGDLVGCDWTVDELHVTESGDVICAMSAQGDCAEYVYERRIRLPHDSATIEVDYRLRNVGDVRLPGYWCAHPLLAVDSGARIEINGQMPMCVDDATTRALAIVDGEQRWPNLDLHSGESVDLSQSFASNGSQLTTASKVFVRTPDDGAASVVLADGNSRLTFRVDPNELPWLGLWINNGNWSGCGSEPYVNLGIEPATVPYDCVNQAIKNDALPWLMPGEEVRWSIGVELQS